MYIYIYMHIYIYIYILKGTQVVCGLTYLLCCLYAYIRLYVDFAKKILSLARKGDSQLLIVFEAAFEEDATSYSQHDKFDSNFFLDNATCILEEAGHDIVNPTSNTNTNASTGTSK